VPNERRDGSIGASGQSGGAAPAGWRSTAKVVPVQLQEIDKIFWETKQAA